jgi:poly-beta-1,6-N-acetyl-D-glucosamine synthase
VLLRDCVTGLSSAHTHLGGLTRRAPPFAGLRPTVLFALASSLTAGYLVFDLWVSSRWRAELEQAVGPVASWVIPTFLAYIPAIVIGFLIFTLLFGVYRRTELRGPDGAWPAVTVVIAAWNEEKTIAETLTRIAGADYPGRLEVVVADNNSTDQTATAAEEAAARLGLTYRRVFVPARGKHNALNTALATVTTPIVVTVDADTYLHPAALAYLVAAITDRPQGQHVSACAGALYAQAPTRTFVTRMQGWDYCLGINGVKRMQAAYNCTLVAQGAFSAYWTEDVVAVGGWPDAIGEDIVLTWNLMASRGLIRYEPLAVAFTALPTKLSELLTQRSRWARGMFEGLRRDPPHRQPRMLAKFVAGVDYLVPFLDIGIICFWVPGVILFLFGYPIIFSWWSMLVIPVTLIIFGLMRRWQERHVFRRLDIVRERDRQGYFGYLFAYQVLISAAALRGYAQYLTGTARQWR